MTLTFQNRRPSENAPLVLPPPPREERDLQLVSAPANTPPSRDEDFSRLFQETDRQSVLNFLAANSTSTSTTARLANGMTAQLTRSADGTISANITHADSSSGYLPSFRCQLGTDGSMTMTRIEYDGFETTLRSRLQADGTTSYSRQEHDAPARSVSARGNFQIELERMIYPNGR